MEFQIHKQRKIHTNKVFNIVQKFTTNFLILKLGLTPKHCN